MVDAVLLILREVLEAALILSLLLALSRKYALSSRWCLLALATGVLGSWLLAHFAYPIAEAVDGTGQELLNSLLYALVALGFVLLALLLMPLLASGLNALSSAGSGAKSTAGQSPAEQSPAEQSPLHLHLSSACQQRQTLLFSLFVLAVSLSLMREGSEIWIYLSGFMQQPEALAPALIGAVIGAGIGMSLGAISYYFLVFMRDQFFLPVLVFIITLLAGGLSMQIAKQLMQIGLLDSGPPLWDSSVLVSEQSWFGELLYALLGYDAQPTALQAIFYLAAITPIVLAALWQLVRAKGKTHA